MEKQYVGAIPFYYAALALLCLAFTPLAAQERGIIYLIDESAIGGIALVDISDKKVKYRNSTGKQNTLGTAQVVLVFNEAGNYLTFPQIDKQKSGLELFVSSKNTRQADFIITLDQRVMPGTIVSENDYELYYLAPENGQERSVGKDQVAIILYKDGKHVLLVSPSQASDILARVDTNIAVPQITITTNQHNIQEPQIAVPDPIYVANHQPVEEVSDQKQVQEVVVAEEEETEAEKPLHLEDQPEATQPNVAFAENMADEKPAPTDAVAPAADETLKIDFDLYSRKALQRTEDLGTYLSLIAGKNTDWIEANKAIDLACKLFLDEEAQVEVTNQSSKTRYKIRQYFNRLKLLKYDHVEISWTDISYVSDLKKGADGNYYGIITLQQRFKGFIDNQIVYSDVTEKNIEVVLKTYEKETEGAVSELWDVFLSDIGVVETKYN